MRLQEQGLDGQCLRIISSLATSKIGNIRSGVMTFYPGEYAKNLMKFYEIEIRKNVTDVTDEQFNEMVNDLSMLCVSTYGLEPFAGAID